MPPRAMVWRCLLHTLPGELRDIITAYVMPLDQAAELGHLAVVKLLVSQHPLQGSGKKSDMRAPIGLALLKSARAGHLQVVRFLYPHCTTPHHNYAVEVAASAGQLSVVQLIHSLLPVEDCRTRAVDSAAAHGHVHVVRFLLEEGGDSFTVAAIDRAAENGHDEVIDLLLQHESKAQGCRELHGRAFTTLAIRWANRNGHTRIASRLQELLIQPTNIT